MTRNEFQHVRSGEKIEIPATAYNAMLDAAQAHRNRRMNLSPHGDGFDSLFIHVENATGLHLQRFDIVGLDGPMETQNLDTFCNRIAFRGVIPTEDHRDRFAIIQQDAAPDMVVRAVVSGPSIARINVRTQYENLAGLSCHAVEDDVIALQFGGGGATVLWIDKGTGDRWAIVQLGSSPITIHVGSVAQEIKPGLNIDNDEHGGSVDEDNGDLGQRAFAGMLMDDDTIEVGTRVEWLSIGGVNRIINADCHSGKDDEEESKNG